jgi:hypothetical protein
MKIFLDDYKAGRAEGRHLVAALPELPFNDREFDLCLCSHLLFLYSAQLSADLRTKYARARNSSSVADAVSFNPGRC